ncbi:hypothetical protein [Actinoplanes sp. URMC 104]|uniref:hypothetical protein n=1 Tax=Actinoplanes sp. URMC 104 TaxID=3423409 RepID=UPI003F1E1390
MTIEVWRTSPVRADTTWLRSPAELEKLLSAQRGPGISPCPSYLGFDMVPTLNAALGRHEKSLKPSPAAQTTSFKATAADADEGDSPTVTYAIWPADDPAQRREFRDYYGTGTSSRSPGATPWGTPGRSQPSVPAARRS